MLCGLLIGGGSALAVEATWHPYTPEWHPAAVAVGERAVVLDVTEDSCGSRNPTLTVIQTRASIEVHVGAEAAVYPGPGVISCPGPRSNAITVALAQPLDGRPLVGAGEGAGARRELSETVDGRFQTGEIVPRLEGFALADARLATEELKLSVGVVRRRSGRGLPHVVWQYPKAGTFVAAGSTVRVALG